MIISSIHLDTLESKKRLKDDAILSQYLRQQSNESDTSKRVKLRRQKWWHKMLYHLLIGKILFNLKMKLQI